METLKKKFYVDSPQGMSDVGKDDSIILYIYIFGFFQAAWQYDKKTVEILKNSEFMGGNVDPCLYIKKSAKGIVYVGLSLDDNLMVGDFEAIDDNIVEKKWAGIKSCGRATGLLA